MLAKQKNIYFVVFLVSVLMVSTSSWAALNVYLTLRGEVQGNIQGGVTRQGLEGTIEVVGFNHEVLSPRDAASGLPTGKRQHKPLTIIKAVDKSSPLLMLALVNNENLRDVTLRFYRPSNTGQEVQYYTIKLTNASISTIKTIMLNNKFSEYSNQEVMEEISFTYQKIEWIFENGGITAEDDWESPVF